MDTPTSRCSNGWPYPFNTSPHAFDRGVNYFDVAPSYFDGEAEIKLGIALEPYRSKSFLGCKTMERTAAGARREFERSLQRAKTDHFDL
jgi:aryl-alcohol dehydrogenase-like predicted oxidoreductase